MTDLLHRLGLTLASTPEEVAAKLGKIFHRVECDCSCPMYVPGAHSYEEDCLIPIGGKDFSTPCGEYIIRELLTAYRQHESETKGEGKQ